ncbi:hypothetical protein PybrP1_009795 [[Pythium] brassicae (nom. inval.)]|nr:hypothetical protein PybrP1_009795 [[Pythium] brassicae (nom. inval.)]
MGCQQSRDEHMALHPSATGSDADAAQRPRLSLSQLLLQHSKHPDAAGSHRDVFSIFGERGMVLEHLEDSSVGAATGETVAAARALESSSCSPPSPAGSVFSTATTASDSERTQVLRLSGQSFPGLALRFGAFSDRGQRKQNEDRHVCASERILDDAVAYFGVYDGHGGAHVADFLADELHGAVFEHLRNSPRDLSRSLAGAFAEADDVIFQRQLESGSTAIAVLIRGATAVVAAVGDSQAVLCSRGQAQNCCALHTPSAPAERARILAANGKISEGRIFGFLGVSRAFGDNDFKTGKGAFKDRFNGDLVIATPEIAELQLAKHDEFLVLASDGLFDVMAPQQVVDFVRKKLAQHGNAQHASEELVSHAISIGSTDNVSAVIVCFNHALAFAAPAESETPEHDSPPSASAAVTPLSAAGLAAECKEAATGTASTTTTSSSS